MTHRERRQRKARKDAEACRTRFQGFGLALFQRVAKARANSKGPMKWCKTCHRYHRTHDTCNLYLRTRTAKSGKKMKVWAH